MLNIMRRAPDICRLCGELAAVEDPGKTLDILAKSIAEALDVKGCTIRLLDEKNLTLRITAAYGLSKAYLEKGPVFLNEHPVDRRVLAGEAVYTRDITKEAHVLYIEEAKKEGIKSVLSVPLTVHERSIGVVRVYTETPHDFTPEEIDSVRMLASIGGILADRARLWQQMEAIMETARSISSTLSLQEVLDKIVESAAKTLGFRASSLRLIDEDGKCLVIKATYGLSKEYIEKGPVELEKSAVDMKCLGGEVAAVEDISKPETLQYPEEIAREGIGALLSVPLAVKGKVIGVLRVYTSVPYVFRENEIKFLLALASQGAIAIENARLFEHVRQEYEELSRDVWRWYDWGARFPRV